MTALSPLSEAIRVLELEARAITDCVNRLSGNPESGRSFNQTVEILRAALGAGGKIIVTGVGKSGAVGKKIAATLSSTGSLSVFLHPTEGLHGDIGILSSKDVVIALSYSGNTEELVRLLPSFKQRGIPVIGMGGNRSSQLGQGATVWLDAAVAQEACPHNLAPTSSTTLALALGDAIAVTLMRVRGFDAQSFAQNHPGGSLGKRLNLQIRDLMHQGEAVATVAPDAPMEQVIVRSTEKKLGIVLVTEGRKLIGVITDGDIRRALSHKERFFQLQAKDILTRSPVTVSASAMATDALTLMQNRPSQISALPVLDDSGGWCGVVRLHDLMKAF